ncbi:unnamed protein product [Arabidopsis halleri]
MRIMGQNKRLKAHNKESTTWKPSARPINKVFLYKP